MEDSCLHRQFKHHFLLLNQIRRSLSAPHNMNVKTTHQTVVCFATSLDTNILDTFMVAAEKPLGKQSVCEQMWFVIILGIQSN